MGDSKKILGPDGSESSSGSERPLTERGVERLQEEEDYQPVIVKRTDEIRRHPDDMLGSAISEGLEQLGRSPLSLGLSAVAAGLVLCFTAMAVAIATQAAQHSVSPLVVRMVPALVYPLGFVACIMSSTQLFTEHTATAVYPLLDGRVSIGVVARLWGVVILGNLLGTGLSSGLLALAEEVIQAREGYVSVARHLVEYPAGSMFVSAVLAGWLMALGAWLLLATSRAFGQIALIYLVTFLIGLGGLHHSIAGSAEMFAAMWLSEEFGAAQAARFISLAVLGNTVGGSCFVAALNYAHIRRTQTVDTSQIDAVD